jgi:hypothetical protein
MLPNKQWSDFSVEEWNRLDRLAGKFERKLKTAYLQTVAQRQRANSLLIRNIITDTVVEVGVTSAHVYGMVFNPNSPSYRVLIDRLTDRFMDTVNNDNAKEKVKEILPTGLSLSQRRARLDVFGLDAGSALRIERMRQAGEKREDIENARLHMSVTRGNLLALTEINRVVNRTLETLWIDNLSISKADDVWYFDETVPNNITSIAGLNSKARKRPVSRRDNVVCNHCDDIEEETKPIPLGTEFETPFGFFISPPFHPRCRCFMIVSV